MKSCLIDQTEALLARLLRLTGAADTVIRQFFRAHPALGHSERSVMTEAVFAVLRRRLEWTYWAEQNRSHLTRCLALLGLRQTVGSDALLPVITSDEAAWLNRAAQIEPASLPAQAQLNLPDWIIAELQRYFDAVALQQVATALNQPAPLDLRVNRLKANRAQLLAALKDADIQAEKTLYAPLGVRVAGKPALHRLPAFNDGWFEVQDEGSQLVSHLVAPRRGEMIADFCAGAGGKTLALGALMRSTGRLYAFDIAEARLAKLKPRLARSGLSDVNLVLIDSEHDIKLKRLAGKFDRVLVDAPCSGLGTLRRNPDLKWRQSPASIAELASKQASILAAAARLVKSGGWLVYATCSLLEAENQAIVTAFLAGHADFALMPAGRQLAQQKIPLEMSDYLSLLPHRHGTDGFFAAVLKRCG